MKTTEPGNFRKWIAALRSGEYAQTKNALHDSVGYCCLGVACDISGIGQWIDTGSKLSYATEDAPETPGYLPLPVAKWLGIAENESAIIHDDHMQYTLHVNNESVAYLNDTGADFGYIADLLEKEYLDGE